VDDILAYVNALNILSRLAIFAGVAVAIHLIVIFVRQLVAFAFVGQQVRRHQKLRSIATLATSAIIFTLYFLAIGLILREFGVSLTA